MGEGARRAAENGLAVEAIVSCRRGLETIGTCVDIAERLLTQG